MSPSIRQHLLDFDIDLYLNRIVPPSVLHRLPPALSHFLGYRAEPVPHRPHVVIWFWSFIGAFSGLLLIAAVYRTSPWVLSLNPPVILSASGAAAILEYGSIESPLAQPRNLIFGQLLSSTIGVGITKLFHLLPTEQFDDLRWVIGALNVATASLVMGMTKTIHPPAGASALVAGTDPIIIAMGWSFIPLVLVSDALMLGTALLLNNIQRRYPQYWWTSQALNAAPAKATLEKSNAPDDASQEKDDEEQAVIDNPASSTTEDESFYEVKITDRGVEVPEWLVLEDIESDLLNNIQGRLRKHNPMMRRRSNSHSTRHSSQFHGMRERASSWVHSEA